MRKAPHPHSLTMAKDPSSENASVTTNNDRPRQRQAVLLLQVRQIQRDNQVRWTGLRDGTVQFCVCRDRPEGKTGGS